MPEMMTPFVDLKTQYASLEPQITERINRVLQHGQFIMGPEVREMEEQLADYVGASHCISVASGTEALLISLMALGIGPGDEVITTPFTFVATVEVIVLLGAKPVFVDIEPDTCNIDSTQIEKKINARTRAIMPVSLFGQCSDMDEINAIAARYGDIPVIEDGAQSFGAEYKTRKSCNLSTIGCTSFFPSKPLGCQSERYVHTRVGVGGRMDTIQCAVVLAKLERFNWEVAQRQEIGKRYRKLLQQHGITTVAQRADRTNVFAQFTVKIDRRDEFQSLLKSAGVPTAVHYPVPLNQQPVYEDLCCAGCTPQAADVSRHVMSLPMHPYLDVNLQSEIVARIVEIAAALR
jgi:UDP-2-acetamido-2-deoxy-ribo-hexuluronate aminotransferase